MAQHVIVIKQNQFRPTSLRIASGDSVIWDNQDPHDHTATSDSRRVQFDTGTIPGGTTSRAVVFGAAAPYGGVEFFCRFHGSMEGRVFVSPGGARGATAAVAAVGSSRAAASVSDPGATYPPETWRAMTRIVAGHWVYDMADNVRFGRLVHSGTALSQLNAAWAEVETFWQKRTGTTKPILDADNGLDPTVFENESRDDLEALGRRIRVARRKLRAAGVLIPQYPFPDRPDDPDSANPFGRLYGGQSDDPFGEAITVNYAGLRLSPDSDGFLFTEVQHAEVRHERWALGPLWLIESKLDAGEPVTDDDKESYRNTRAQLRVQDYHDLAAHLYFGLSKLFKSGSFREDQFVTGIRRMTARGEWDGSWQPMWHWLRWIDGYQTVRESSQLPDPLGLG